jgi:hypothetical protein
METPMARPRRNLTTVRNHSLGTSPCRLANTAYPNATITIVRLRPIVLEMRPAKSAPNSCPRTTAEVTTEVMKVDRSKAGTRKRRALAMEPRSQPYIRPTIAAVAAMRMLS